MEQKIRLSEKYVPSRTNGINQNGNIQDYPSNNNLAESSTQNPQPIVQSQPNQQLGQNISQQNIQAQQNSGTSSYINRMRSKPRECTMLVLVGEVGVGKSHSVIYMAKGYVRDNPHTGKKGRPVFIFDVNGEPEYAKAFPKTIIYTQVKDNLPPDVYRILPIKEDGMIMEDDEEIRQTMIYIATHSRRCAVVFDDIDAYFEGAKPRALSRLFMGFRHRGGRDVIFTHQRLSAIYPRERAGAKIISLRHTTESVESIRDRWRNPELMAIAENIVEEQYELAEIMYMKNKISEEEYRKRRAFFVEIDVRLNKIIGQYSKKCFIRNCRKYINLNNNIINKFQKIHCDNDGKPLYDRQKSIEQIINTRMMRYFAGKE